MSGSSAVQFSFVIRYTPFPFVLFESKMALFSSLAFLALACLLQCPECKIRTQRHTSTVHVVSNIGISGDGSRSSVSLWSVSQPLYICSRHTTGSEDCE